MENNMSGFCGWFGQFNHINSPAQTLQQMSVSLGSLRKDYITDTRAISVNNDTANNSTLHNKNISIVISGYPYWTDKELDKIAKDSGNAIALHNAYQKYQTSLFDYLYGDFAFVLIDILNDRLLGAIDRMGVRSLNFNCIDNGSIIFGTRANTVHANPSAQSDICPQALYHYLFFHVVPSPLTIFTKQKKLQPGQYVLSSNGKCQTSNYWQPKFVYAEKYNLAELEEELILLLHKSVKRCAQDSNTGSFLSGGIDSSTVSGILSEINKTNTKTYSIGFEAQGYDELKFARISAKHFSTELIEYYVTPQNVIDMVPNIASFYDEPFGNSSALPAYYCAKLAKDNGTTTMLAGDGGDELFAGNIRYLKQDIYEYYNKLPYSLRQYLIEPLIYSNSYVNKLPLLRKVCSYIDQAKITMPERLEIYNFLCRTPLEMVFHPEFITKISKSGPFDLMRDTYNSVNAKTMLNKMLGLDWKHTLADNDLRKVSGMCELAGINVRYPFLNDELVDFSLRIPPKIKIKGRKLRYFFKHAERNYLPKEVLNKSKHGFGLPFGLWMKSYTPLKEMAYDSVTDFKKRNIVNNEYLDRIINLHNKEHAIYYGEFIWIIMMLEFWLKEQ